MKICILTQTLGHNYGGIMQNFALQKVLKKIGHDIWTEDKKPNQENFWRAIKYQCLYLNAVEAKYNIL